MISESKASELKKILPEQTAELGSMLENFPTTVCVQKKDDGSFSAFSPHFMVGVAEGLKSPEDAIAELWLRIERGKMRIKKGSK